MSPYKRGLWTAEEDKILIDYVTSHGLGHWNLIPKRTGLKRCGKSCRLRWMNYLSPTVKKGRFSDEEEDLIIRLHKLIGNRWSLIAKRVPGRTDNQVKNYWNTHLSKKVVGIGLYKLHQPPMLVASSSTARLSQAAQSDAAAVKERQSSNEVDKTLNRLVEEEDCVKSFWDFDHQLTALNMAELLQGYPKQQPICMDYDS